MIHTSLLASLLVLTGPQGPGGGGGGSGPIYSAAVLASHLPTRQATAHGLNNRGELVGDGIEQLVWEGVHWPDPQSPVNFTTAFGFEASLGGGINDSGAIVGAASLNITTDKESIFLRLPGQAPQFLPQLVEHPLIRSAGLDITNNGLIAGYCDTLPAPGVLLGQSRAVLWENGVPRDLGTIGGGGDVSTAHAVNESKLVVGYSNSAASTLVQGFGWTPTTGMVALPGPSPSARTWVGGVNDAGLIVGSARFSSGVPPAGVLPVTWPDLQTLVQLPLLRGDNAGMASGVNNHDQIVGSGSPSPSEARLWQSGRVYDLGELTRAPAGVEILGCKRINDRGQILAQARQAGAYVDVLLTPDLPWTDLGQGLAGTNGVPVLAGFGNFLPAGPIVLEVDNAQASAPALLIIGASAAPVPLFGGTLVPGLGPPGAVTIALVTDGAGRAETSFRWPRRTPAGLRLWYQAWVLDSGGPQGFAATNALRSVGR